MLELWIKVSLKTPPFYFLTQLTLNRPYGCAQPYRFEMGFSILIHNGIIVDQVNAQTFCQKLFVRFFLWITVLKYSNYFYKKSQISPKHIWLIYRKNKTFLPLRYSRISFRTYNIKEGLYKINSQPPVRHCSAWSTLRGYTTLIWHFLGEIYCKLTVHEKNRKC